MGPTRLFAVLVTLALAGCGADVDQATETSDESEAACVPEFLDDGDSPPGLDFDCDGQVDLAVAPGCFPSPVDADADGIVDGLDLDCDGLIDVAAEAATD